MLAAVGSDGSDISRCRTTTQPVKDHIAFTPTGPEETETEQNLEAERFPLWDRACGGTREPRTWNGEFLDEVLAFPHGRHYQDSLTRIAFHSDRIGGVPNIFIMNAYGSAPTLVPNSGSPGPP